MNDINSQFEQILSSLPEQRLSRQADRRIQTMLRQKGRQLEGKRSFGFFWKQLVAVPVAFAVVFSTMGGYAYYSPAVVEGDLLYGVKEYLENSMYPLQGASEDRIRYHLQLSDRRYAEAEEIAARLDRDVLAFVPQAFAADELDNPNIGFLADTLQRATDHVDYAFLIADEISEPDRVKVVRQQIGEKVGQHRDFLGRMEPVLKKVHLPQGLARRFHEVVSSQGSSNIIQASVVSGVVESSLVDDARAFLADRIAYQEMLLQDIARQLDRGQHNERFNVDFDVNGFIDQSIDQKQDFDDVFGQALYIHLQQKKIRMEKEWDSLDPEVQQKQQRLQRVDQRIQRIEARFEEPPRFMRRVQKASDVPPTTVPHRLPPRERN
ncbi:MAG: hypothetical protein Q8O95_03880 [bacterium]|nr:hypothetical protein [bacterium]